MIQFLIRMFAAFAAGMGAVVLLTPQEPSKTDQDEEFLKQVGVEVLPADTISVAAQPSKPCGPWAEM